MFLIDAKTQCLCVCTILHFWAVLDCHLICWLIHLSQIPVWYHIHSQVTLLHGLCSLHSYMVFQSALTIFTVSINKSPKTSLKSCMCVGESFHFPWKKLSWSILFQNTKTLFSWVFHVMWFLQISKLLWTIEIGNLKRWKHPNGVEYCLELFNCLQTFLR